MSDLPAPVETDDEEPDLSARPSALLRRNDDLLGTSRSKIRERLAKLAADVWRGFEDQSERADSQADYWDCYNCVINGNQFYNGIAQIYWPIIHDAINARATRFVNQLFPQTGRYVEVVAADGSVSNELVGLVEHYIRQARFQTQILKPLCRNGDIEGQYNLYCDWMEIERHLVSRSSHGPIDPQTGAELPGPEIKDIVEEEVAEGMPFFEVLHDCDVLVLPATVDSIEEALEVGGSVTIVRRWTRAKIDQMEDSGAIGSAQAKQLRDEMTKVADTGRDQEKRLAEHVGIHAKGGMATAWETWHKLPLAEGGGYSEKGTPRLARIFFGPNRVPLGVKRNPHWNDRCPLLSCATEKVSGVFKGPSLIAPVSSIQYEANDAVNEGADAATLSAAPIVTRDTQAYNGPLVYNVGAVWDIPPDAVKLLTFPDLTPRAQVRVQMAIQQIFQTLGVNPSMLPQQMRAGKPNQAQVAQEQAVDLLTTAEAVKVLEEGILTPAMGWAVDLDYQFRDKDIMVRQFGDMGVMAAMEEVAPLQNRHGFSFVWRGGEQVKQTAMMQQQGTSWINVLKGMRQELMQEGMALRLAPLLEAGTQNIFGPFQASRTLVDMRAQMTLDTQMEIALMLDGFQTHPKPMDNDQEKIQAFHQALQQGDPHGTIRLRLAEQMQAMQAKAQAQMMQQMQQQMQGGGPPGGPRQPQPGATPAGPHAPPRQPGAVHPDQGPASGVVPMPRRS